MIDQAESRQRFDALSQMSAENTALQKDVEALTKALNANRLRAEHAERLVHQLESQLTHPTKEACTLVQLIGQPEDRKKADAELAQVINDRWERFDCAIIANPGESTVRIVTLTRTAPIEPASDQPPLTASATVNESLTVVDPAPEPEYPADPVAYPPLHPSIVGLWDALYDLTRFDEYVQHAPRQMAFAPRIYAVLEGAGCNMAGAKIMKSFKPSRVHDEWTMTVLFPKSSQIAKGTGDALEQAGFTGVIARDGRQFIFDLPLAWITPPKTVKADAVFEASLTPDEPARNFGHITTDRAALNAQVNDPDVSHEDFYRLVIHSRLLRPEQDELIAQSRHFRVGGQIARQMSRLPLSQSRPLRVFQAGAE